MDLSPALRALANDKRLLILEWLKAPRAHFREQVDGDLVDDGVCSLFIAEKLGVSQPTLTVHMRALLAAGFVQSRRLKGWTFYKRDDAQIAATLEAIKQQV